MLEMEKIDIFQGGSIVLTPAAGRQVGWVGRIKAAFYMLRTGPVKGENEVQLSVTASHFEAKPNGDAAIEIHNS